MAVIIVTVNSYAQAPQSSPGNNATMQKPSDIGHVYGKLTDADKTYLGTPFPKFSYGFTANFSYGPFDMSVFLQGIAGNKLFNAVKYTGLNASIQN